MVGGGCSNILGLPQTWGVKLIGILINQYFGVGLGVAGAQNFEAM